jgi:hypothetical protein
MVRSEFSKILTDVGKGTTMEKCNNCQYLAQKYGIFHCGRMKTQRGHLCYPDAWAYASEDPYGFSSYVLITHPGEMGCTMFQPKED